jgi:hypothetical protein
MQSRIGLNVLALSIAMLALLAASTPVAAQQIHYITLQNDTNITFREVHVSKSADLYWESDLLGRDYLRPGYQFTVEMRTGNWDFQLIDGNGDACILPNVAVYRNATVAVTTKWLEDNCTFDLSRR